MRKSSPASRMLSGHDAWLIGVQNGLQPHRVVALRLAADGRRVDEMRVLAAALPQFDEPTQGAIAGERFHFIANSHWNRFDGDARLPAEETLSGPIVLGLDLP